MTAVSRTEKIDRLSLPLVRRAYLGGVWLWLLVCLLFPTWTGKSHRYDTGSERWQTNGAFGITGSGNPFTSRAPIWSPPRSSGGLPTAVRWPLSPIKAGYSIEIQMAATLWRITNGMLFTGLVVMVLRWTNCVRESDRVLLLASTIAVALLTANIVLSALGAASMGFALISEVVIGVLGVAMALGIVVGGYVLRVSDRKTPPHELDDAPKSTSPDALAVTDPQGPSKTSTLSAMRSLNWWWRIPAYLVFQFFVWGLVAGRPWPVGRDVFGPYPVEPVSVVTVYCLQFLLLPFLARRFQVFSLTQLLVIVLIYLLPDWPQGGNVFAPLIRVPAIVLPLFWIQFVATLVLFWRGPYLAKQLASMRSRPTNGVSP